MARAAAFAPVDTIDVEAFLALGAVLGVVGWGTTQTLTWWPSLAVSPAAVVVGVWLALAVGTAALCLSQCAPGILRTRPVLVWGITGAVAMTVTVGGLLGYVASTVAYWQVWAGACTVGYLVTGLLFVHATDDDLLYAVAGVAAFVLLVVGTVAFDALAPVRYLLLGMVHATPLVLGAYGPRRGWSRAAVLLVAFVAVLGVAVAL